ncbi:hypothetical protein FQA39_LY02866 [Lamprigera yunnana]|nr:hypothetical protein FQA39_LY02866 [Lamprigera yunnana]
MSSIADVLTIDFLEKMLKINKILKFDTQQFIESGDNFCSALIRIRVTYSTENDEKSKVLSLIAKYRLETEEMIFLDEDMKLFVREIGTYGEILPEMHKIDPKIKFAPSVYSIMTTPLRMLLLEDVATNGYTTVSRQDGLDLEHCFKMVEKLAYFHALSVVIYEKNPEIMAKYDRAALSKSKVVNALLEASWDEVTLICEKTQDFKQYYKKVRSIENIVEKTNDAIDLTSKFKVLNHGDFWCGNSLFYYGTDKQLRDIIFVDYQQSFFSSPAIDLHYFLTTSTNVQVKKEHIQTVLYHYFDKLLFHLKELNINNIPTREQLFDDFKTRASYGLASLCMAMPIIKSDSRKDAGLVKFAEESGEGSFRHHCFNNKNYIENLEPVLSFYDSLGAFD